MDSSLKCIFVATVLLGVVSVISASACASGKVPQPTATYCTFNATDAPKITDKCTAKGYFKSNSFCYKSNRGFVGRWDYYYCAAQPGTPTGFVMTKYCCDQPCTETTTNGTPDCFNYYNTATSRCDLPAPPPVTTSAAGDATTPTSAS